MLQSADCIQLAEDKGHYLAVRNLWLPQKSVKTPKEGIMMIFTSSESRIILQTCDKHPQSPSCFSGAKAISHSAVTKPSNWRYTRKQNFEFIC